MVLRRRHSLREGVILGLVVATSIWLWIAIVDAIAGEPFRTFAVLGGIRLFTVLHYVLCLVYGVAAVAVVHGAALEPSLMLGAAFAFFILEFGFVMLTVLLSRSEEHTSELQSPCNLVCRLLLEKKKLAVLAAVSHVSNLRPVRQAVCM